MSTEQSPTPENSPDPAPDDLPPPAPTSTPDDTPPPPPSAPAEETPPPAPSVASSPAAAPSSGSPKDKKILAGIMAILFGGLGVHKFILGYTKEGVIQLIVGLVFLVLSCGTLYLVPWIVGLVEGIIYLTKSDEEFEQTYMIGRKPWF